LITKKTKDGGAMKKNREAQKKITLKQFIQKRRTEASELQVDEKVYFISKYLGQFKKKSDEDEKKIKASFVSKNGETLQMIFEYKYSEGGVKKRFVEINLKNWANKIYSTIYRNSGCVEINKLSPKIHERLNKLVSRAEKIRVKKKTEEIKSIRRFEASNKKDCDYLPQLLEDWLPFGN
jgi:hypothetical protein